ncbi:aldehyde dehydrogenase domain-containing protein [Peziza echinospora]|nr:aldehyde dehydrogenase domain-containing protein [Peziza echinospora]
MAQPKIEIESRLFLNNQFVPSVKGKQYSLVNPASEEHVVDVHEAQPEDIDLAVEYAKAALPGWKNTHVRDRAAAVNKLADLIEQDMERITYLDSVSVGKSKTWYPYEIKMNLDLMRYFCGVAQDLQGETSSGAPGHVNMTWVEPYGITAAICAWNTPITQVGGKIAPSLLTGNVLILKSSEKAPLSLIRIAQLVKEHNVFPPGVLQIITGFGLTAGAPLASHMEIRKLAFTGSCATGKIIKELAAKSNLKNVTLELGGKSPLIIFPDADLDLVAGHSGFAIAGNAGQGCVALSRMYVHTSVADQFLTKISASMLQAAGKFGNLLEDGTHQPQVDKQQFTTVMNFIESGKKSGAQLALGGKRVGEKGFFIEPTIFFNPPDDADIVRKEIFGPVACVMTFDTEEEVVKRANDTEFGLNAAIYTKDISRALRVAKQIESGMVGINTNVLHAMAMDLPFGGVKASGDGVENSRAGLLSWTHVSLKL